MKNPCTFSVQLKDYLVINLKRSNPEAGELTEHFIMITGQVDNPGVFCQQPRNMLDDLHMRFGPIPLGKLPHVDNVAIEDYFFWVDRFKIPKQVFRMAAIGTKVDIR